MGKNAFILFQPPEADTSVIRKFYKDRGYTITDNEKTTDNLILLLRTYDQTEGTYEELRKYEFFGALIYTDNEIPAKVIESLINIKYTILNKDKLNNHDYLLMTIGALVHTSNPIRKQETNPIRKQETKRIPSTRKDTDDTHELLHGREQHYGTKVQGYLPPPMLFNRDGHNIWLADMYRGRSAFLILGGPSFTNLNKTLLDRAGILTMGVNNSVKSYRTNLWISVDNPMNFMKSIWLDPKITKFAPFTHKEKNIFDNETWKETTIRVGDCPNIWFYRRNEHFVADQFLWEDTFNWGNHSDLGGGRSIMLVAVRLLFYLGIRCLYLLGCDFKMNEQAKYHFDQDRTNGAIRNNNNTYSMLIERFKQLKPIFDNVGYKIYNCNEESALKVFPFISFEEAISLAASEMPRDIASERTAGLYERLAEERSTKEATEIENNLERDTKK